MLVDVRWTREAREDLLGIYVLIGLKNPTAADRYYDKIEEKALLLSIQPRVGVRREDIRPSFRMLIEYPYLVLYRTDPDTDYGPVDCIEIVRVVDGRRDLKAI
jgi:toxin ParE1/3/4